MPKVDMEIFRNIVETKFNENIGFGQHTPLAVKILFETVNLLNEYNINYSLISGTLLGKIRHNSFIPWDDDIDLIVDNSIIDKIPNIIDKYKDTFTFFNPYDNIYKICFSNMGIKMQTDNHSFKKTMINKGEYNWPFIDLFVYSTNDSEIRFFNENWQKNKFLPFVKTNFMNIDVNIPADSHYFLKKNYGENYMEVLTSNGYIHKNEQSIKDVISIGINSYNSFRKMV